MAFYVPKSTIYIHSNTRRLLEVNNLYHKGNEIIKFRNLEIWKLLDIKNIYHNKNEIIKFGGEAIKYKKRNINETKIQKDWKIKRLIQGYRNRCEAKKLIVLNYTERGKRQKIYNYFYTISILYTVITYNIFLYNYQFFLHIGYILENFFPIQYSKLNLTYFIVKFYIHTYLLIPIT